MLYNFCRFRGLWNGATAVAMKKISTKDDEATVIAKEAKLLSTLAHPHIVCYYGVTSYNGKNSNFHP